MLKTLARACGFDLIDYGNDRGPGVLIASGTGIMMSIMDTTKTCRWCVDIDTARRASAVDLAIVLSSRVPFLGLAGWFTIDDAGRFREILDAKLPCEIVAYGGNVSLGARSLAEFLSTLEKTAYRCDDELLGYGELPRRVVGGYD